MKTKKKKPRTVFTFWRVNLKAGEHSMTIQDIKDKYREFLRSKELDWIQYYGHHTVVAFITSEEGLNSNFDERDIYDLESQLMPVRHELYPK